MNDLQSRIAWAISVVRTDQTIGGKLKDDDLVKLFGVAKNTLLAYEKGLGSLKAVVIDALTNKFNFNLLWIYKGEGEPYPGARSRYPEVCGTIYNDDIRKVKQSLASESTPHKYAPSDNQGFSISDDLALAARVLESKTHYATALHLNIRSFAAGLHDNSIASQVDDLKRRLEEMEGTIKTLQEDNKTLRKEVNRLTATYENPEGRDGSLTNTAS